MSMPKPIRYSRDEWLCMRNDPALPKAIIRRVHVINRATGAKVEKFRAVTWSIETDQRELVGYFDDVRSANEAVLYDVVVHGPIGPANGIRA
ncbi:MULTISPECIES: hypothetical protein [unclassified Cryobacterium]|uniref:hypothetical protein n=1 Tax=unclassified Cryobacterium TaxID=2649013 RepID=UPI002AB4D107|nr:MULTISPECIES: hypothetical protein [unclassified Cryobacterium]MDY7542585.1 hypothetical protein [Cryobacterium sp. 5B3]MEB0264705.1 hypothetical protein [Cryobacterium sp. 10I5]MEB0273677.1 hypothetical protein [Cryobacterium sp. 5B3]